jgi:predicted small secreted protein
MNKLIALAVLLFAVSSLSACNTVSGIGKDTQAAGKAIEKTAEGNK